jgi:hypothetical protein
MKTASFVMSEYPDMIPEPACSRVRRRRDGAVARKDAIKHVHPNRRVGSSENQQAMSRNRPAPEHSRTERIGLCRDRYFFITPFGVTGLAAVLTTEPSELRATERHINVQVPALRLYAIGALLFCPITFASKLTMRSPLLFKRSAKERT